jgi:hypothetical protein
MKIIVAHQIATLDETTKNTSRMTSREAILPPTSLHYAQERVNHKTTRFSAPYIVEEKSVVAKPLTVEPEGI